MPIIGISKKSKNTKQRLKSLSLARVCKFKAWICIAILMFIFCGLNFLTGCTKKSQLDQAGDYARQSQDYYQRAIAEYEDLISQGKDLDQAHFELGLLYYQYAEYELASEHLLNTSLPEAKKYHALALYRINDFAEAKDAFRKIDSPDAQTLYYYGQTCEKLNLYDEAIDLYSKITQEPFQALAMSRIQSITRTGDSLHLESLPEELQQIVKAAKGEDEYPNAGALILFCDEQVELTPQNTAVFSGHIIVKILNERGKQDFSETVISYDSTYDKVELEYARTIRPDRTVVPVGSRHIRDVSKYLNFPLYSNARARIISFPEITAGCIIEYKYKVYRNQLINDDDFILSYQLQESEPVIQAKLKLVLPLNTPLHYKILNSEQNISRAKLEPEIKIYPEYKEYLWEFKDIPAIIPEADMPPVSRINPIILVSTFDSWQEVYDWWWNLAQDRVQADPAIKQKVSDLTSDKESIRDKLRAIYNFCAEDIRYVAVEYGQAGYQPHKAADIFFNKYGDCKDQAILLITMLREIGIESYPVLIGTYEYLDLQTDFPSVNFNHCIAAVRLDDGLVFLDPTCSTCSFGSLPNDDQHRRVLVFTDTGYEIQTTPLYPAEHNQTRQILRMEINPDETIQAERAVFTFGLYDAGQRAWLKYSSDEIISESLKQVIQGVSPAARLIKYDIQNLGDLNKNVVLNYSFSGQEYWTKAGKLRILPQLASLNTSIAAKELRRFPVDLGLLSTRITELDITLPPRFKLKNLPGHLTRSSPWLDISVEYNMQGNHFYFKQITRVKKRDVSLAEYPQFKDFIEDSATQIRERVVFQSG